MIVFTQPQPLHCWCFIIINNHMAKSVDRHMCTYLMFDYKMEDCMLYHATPVTHL